MRELLIAFNKKPDLLNNFQYNIALMVTLFNFKQVDLYKILKVGSGTFSNYLNFDQKKKASMPKHEKLEKFEEVFFIDAARFRKERLQKEDFDTYIKMKGIQDRFTINTGTFGKINETLNTGTFGQLNKTLNSGVFGQARELQKKFKKYVPTINENQSLNEGMVLYNNGVPIFNLEECTGYFSEWNKKGLIGYALADTFFDTTIDFVVKILDSSMVLEEHPYNIPFGSILGLREISSLKQPIQNKVYLVSTRTEKPMVKLLKLIDQENEVVELESLNKTNYPQKISYNFNDAPVFYDVAAVIFPSVVFN